MNPLNTRIREADLNMITIACVRTGNKYGIEYVVRLRNMVRRHLPLEHEIICITDQPEQVSGVRMIPLKYPQLDGWWAKMALFEYQCINHHRTVYLDLDTVIVGDLSPLAAVSGFAICENFTKLAGHRDWPCNYGSCVMVLPPYFGAEIWAPFESDMQSVIAACPKGDQQAIELLYPNADYLQEVLPTGYLIGRRDFTDEQPVGASLMIFAGKHKPHNTPHTWLKEAWG